jgi:hypothetical protein
MLQIIKSIRSAELEETLLVLPFADILQILTHLDTWIKRGKEIELCTRCLFFLLQMHQVQLSANKAMRVRHIFLYYFFFGVFVSLFEVSDFIVLSRPLCIR